MAAAKALRIPHELALAGSHIRLELFEAIPAWAIVHAARDNRTAPLIRQGEVAVVESDGQTGTIPEDGGLYLIEYITPPIGPYGRERRSRDIVHTCRASRAEGRWFAHPYARRPGVFMCSDGPYPDEYVLADKILGKVIGIYRPPVLPSI